jgi:hypothetical protein
MASSGGDHFQKTKILPATTSSAPTFAPGSPLDIALQSKVKKKRALRRPHMKPEVLKRIERGEQGYEEHKKAKELGRIINKEHTQYHLSFGMMLGIYSSVVATTDKIGAERLHLDEFMRVRKLSFPPQGSLLTPPHALPRMFKFKDYAPNVFHHLRQRFAIDQQDYLNSLGGAYEYIEFNSNSKSGSFFFYSHDGKYMIKTQSKAESKFLRRILAHYYQYAMTHPHTYITRFYGMHRIKMPHIRRKIHFVVMQSVFFGDNDIHEMYDLKGSTVGRAATEKEKARGPGKCVYKDLDLIASGTKIKLGAERKEAFVHQLAQDAEFLQSMSIMDYSLLLGVHHRSARVPLAPSPASMQYGQSQGTLSQLGSQGAASIRFRSGEFDFDAGVGVWKRDGEVTSAPAPVVRYSSNESAFSAMSAGSTEQQSRQGMFGSSAPSQMHVRAQPGPPVPRAEAPVGIEGELIPRAKVQLDAHTTMHVIHKAKGPDAHVRPSLILPLGISNGADELFQPPYSTAVSHGSSSRNLPQTLLSPVPEEDEVTSGAARVLRVESDIMDGASEMGDNGSRENTSTSAVGFSHAKMQADITSSRALALQNFQSIGHVQSPRTGMHFGLGGIRGAPSPSALSKYTGNGNGLLSGSSAESGGAEWMDPQANGGGIRGMEPDGTPSDEIYYFGIIDILQQYDLRKMGETVFKSFYQPVAGISAVPPKRYAERFVKFIDECTE